MKLYRAVVEDNLDPLENSRVKVRIFGMHTQMNEHSSEPFSTVDVKDLPWSEVIGDTNFGLINGVGVSSVLRQGTWVWVVLDHDNPNNPVVVGVVKGTVKTRPKYKSGEGFNDKDEVYPYDARTEESDTNRLCNGKKLADPHYDNPVSVYSSTDTVHKQINDNVDVVSGVSDSISGADVSGTEPNSTNDLTTYPNSAVLETPGGHIFEFDDTKGNERVRLYHTSGSYVEIKPDGSIVQKAVNTTGTSHYIHMSDVHEHIAKGVKRYIETNLEEIILGGIKQNVKMDLFKHIGGAFKITANGNLEISNAVKITGDIEIGGACSVTGNVVSGAQVTDSQGNLSSLRDAYDAHYHIGNLGVPTGNPLSTDPKTRASSVPVTVTASGFK